MSHWHERMTDSGEFADYLEAQCDAIEEFKWILGVHLDRDPLELFTFDEIAVLWIDRFAASFRTDWNNTHLEL